MSSQNTLKSFEARDPATSVQRLYEIAAASPELHLDVLFNPSCTSGLRSWIAQANPQALATWQAAHLGASASSPAAAPAQTTPPVAAPTADLATAETADLASAVYNGPTAGSPAFAATPAAYSTAWSGATAYAPMPDPTQPSPHTAVLPAMDPLTVPTAEASSMGGWEMLPAAAWTAAPSSGLGGVVTTVNPQPVPPQQNGSAWRWVAIAAVLLLVAGGGVLLGSKLRGGDDAKAANQQAADAPATHQAATEQAAPQQAATKEPASASPTPTPSSTPSGRKVRPAPDNAYHAALFDTPTQNISCELSDYAASCSIAERSYAQSGQPDCAGRLFSISVGNESPALVCEQSFLGSPGQFVQRVSANQFAASKNYACLVENSGVSCWNQWTGHGFKIAREGYETF
ncbi:Uncharacterised protein [Actinomyces bovis]|uniref:Leucine rich repeat variant domain-containing protein n=1 Tax=Actinomyces bovis TaxID=1658 RepID=A0ABY1VLH8_9ACTO|nr:hypothetical protein [Actinomyces bovis]SPT52946.1 Uncharacterised protein [Actinomyces bovis]VEG55131.1 Uncharacterised protein [Actinomyces israelii]